MAQLLQQLQAVLIGKTKVEHHDVELRHLEHRPGSRCRGDVLHRQALCGEAGDNAAGDQLIVFANQYVHGRSMSKNASQADVD
ncbi:hypothetical protein D3C78_1877830 [compost metagenome]